MKAILTRSGLVIINKFNVVAPPFFKERVALLVEKAREEYCSEVCPNADHWVATHLLEGVKKIDTSAKLMPTGRELRNLLDPDLLCQIIQSAAQWNPWDFSNEVLYKLCRDNPRHDATDVIIAKILLIGRVYAAAIERRKSNRTVQNDDFYVTIVAPAIMESGIDTWIEQATNLNPEDETSSDVLVEIHARTTDLFRKISDLEKRSLASKYLHFHVPNLFYIYDSRAVEGIRLLAPFIGKVPPCKKIGDPEYAQFVKKCEAAKKYFRAKVGTNLQPRQLDNLLLILSWAKGK